jgi:uncharacterized membrane protein YjfL (UPF0719 family)
MPTRIFRIACVTGFLPIELSAIAANTEEGIPVLAPLHTVWQLLLHCSLFGGLGIVLVIAGFKIFDWVITKIDLEAEIAKGNVAAAILSAAAILGISLIVAAAIN